MGYRTKAENRELDAKAKIYNSRWEELHPTFVGEVVAGRKHELLTPQSNRFLEHHFTFYKGEHGKVEIVVKPATKVGGIQWTATGRVQFTVRRITHGYRRLTTTFKENEYGQVSWAKMRAYLDNHLNVITAAEEADKREKDQEEKRLEAHFGELGGIPIPDSLKYSRVMDGVGEGKYDVTYTDTITLAQLRQVIAVAQGAQEA